MHNFIFVALTPLDSTMQRRVFCWIGALCQVSNTGLAWRPERLGRSERRPKEGCFFRWKCPAQGWCLKSRGCIVMIRTDSCRFKRHPALPFIRRLWQRSLVSCSYDAGGNRWWVALKCKGLIHWTNGASWRCLPWWQWLVDFFLEGSLPLCG